MFFFTPLKKHCVHYVLKRVFLSSYIFYFRQNGHKVNNKCGTSCGQCGLRGQKRVVVCDHSLLIYIPYTFLVIAYRIKFLGLHILLQTHHFAASCSNFFSLYFVMVKKWITGTFPLYFCLYILVNSS